MQVKAELYGAMPDNTPMERVILRRAVQHVVMFFLVAYGNY